MVIDISGVSISIPNHISDWMKENEDNKTEFYGMLDSIMYAVKTFYKNKYKSNPYQEIYEKQVQEFIDLGGTKEQADLYIKKLIEVSYNNTEKQCDEDGINAILEICKQLYKK